VVRRRARLRPPARRHHARLAGHPGQRLAEVTGGAVFADGLGELAGIRQQLRWYPDQLWWFLLACQWERIAEEEAFPGRCAEVGDDLGCRVVATRIVRDLMRLALLMERRYAPYGKWLGTAFAALRAADHLGPALRGAVEVSTWFEREAWLGEAYRQLAAGHNALGLTDPLDESIRTYFDRPFRVIGAGRFAAALRARITDAEIVSLPAGGAIDQLVDSTAVLTDPRRCREVVHGAMAPRDR